jgi:hypothetical protein
MSRTFVILVLGCRSLTHEACSSAPMQEALEASRAHKEPKAMGEELNDDVVSVFHEATVGDGGESVEVVGIGESSLELTFNSDKVPQIGTWRHAIARSTFDHLVRTLHATGYEDLPSNLIPGVSGDLYGEQRRGEAFPRRKGFGSLPPEMFEVLSLLGGIRAELRAHPARVVRGEARWKSERVSQDSPLEFELVLSNIGREPFLFSNPQHGAPSEWNGLRVVLDPLEKGKQADNYGQFDLTPADVRSIALGPSGAPKPVLPDQPTLRLEAGESLSLTGRTRVSGDEATYEARLIVGNMISSNQPEYGDSVPGTLWLYPGRVTLIPSSR